MDSSFSATWDGSNPPMVCFSPITGSKTKRIVEGDSQCLWFEALGIEKLFGHHSKLGYLLGH